MATQASGHHVAFEASCCCGASIKLLDKYGTYARAGGEPDEAGAIFQAEARYAAWVRLHEGCVAPEQPRGE